MALKNHRLRIVKNQPRILLQRKLIAFYHAQEALRNALTLYEIIHESIARDLGAGAEIEEGVCELILEQKAGKIEYIVAKREA